MKPEEYLALFETLVAWGNEADTARHIIHDCITKLAEMEAND